MGDAANLLLAMRRPLHSSTKRLCPTAPDRQKAVGLEKRPSSSKSKRPGFIRSASIRLGGLAAIPVSKAMEPRR